ncbi:hypothetical protein LJR034_004683 [Caballeronia sp. LjRoot34]|uniref:hypothetical protein n=1 Tax=Caballeronia sp. LjRoot34 TaxID=3342325 RepID=UPI003ECC8159
MTLKTIIAKVVSWFRGEAKTVEQKAEAIASDVKIDAEADASAVLAHLAKQIVSPKPAADLSGTFMSTPAATPATTASNVNAAIQIALALKAIDASLSVDAVQAATNAALAALYPVA